MARVAKAETVSTKGLKQEVAECSYFEQTICNLLSIRDVPLAKPEDLPLYLQRLQAANDPAALCTAFWLLHQHGRRKQIDELLGAEVVKQLMAEGFIREASPGVVEATVDLYPCLGDVVLTDPLFARNYADDHVYQLGTDSYVIARVTPRKQGKRALDLCTGSGIHAIQSAHLYEESYGIDLNPRALKLSKYNAGLNGLSNCHFLEGDLYAPVAGKTFELITVNPPFVPTPDTSMHIHRTGGESGEEISERLVKGLPTFLEEGGLFSMVLDFPVMHASTYLQRLRSWLGESKGWGIAVLNMGHQTVESYIRDHCDPSDANYFDMYEQYLASYQRQGIYQVGFGNVFIQRLPKDHPGYDFERLMITPYDDQREQIADWLDGLATFNHGWQPDWENWKPKRTKYVADIWTNHAGTKGQLEFLPSYGAHPVPVSGNFAKLLGKMNGRLTAGQLAERWAAMEKKSLNEAKAELGMFLRGLGQSLLCR
jgi:SAM-dependent methyltransferase